jgi:hypothetical protein
VLSMGWYRHTAAATGGMILVSTACVPPIACKLERSYSWPGSFCYREMTQESPLRRGTVSHVRSDVPCAARAAVVHKKRNFGIQYIGAVMPGAEDLGRMMELCRILQYAVEVSRCVSHE